MAVKRCWINKEVIYFYGSKYSIAVTTFCDSVSALVSGALDSFYVAI
jgi:hypothetical protein